MEQQENSSVTEGENAQTEQPVVTEVHEGIAATDFLSDAAPEVLPFIEPTAPETPTPLDDTPTIEDAQLMFAENSGLSSVLTDEGWLSREGILTVALSGQ